MQRIAYISCGSCSLLSSLFHAAVPAGHSNLSVYSIQKKIALMERDELPKSIILMAFSAINQRAGFMLKSQAIVRLLQKP